MMRRRAGHPPWKPKLGNRDRIPIVRFLMTRGDKGKMRQVMQKAPGFISFGIGKDLFDAIVFDDFSLMHDDRPLRELSCQSKIVCHE